MLMVVQSGLAMYVFFGFIEVFHVIFVAVVCCRSCIKDCSELTRMAVWTGFALVCSFDVL